MKIYFILILLLISFKSYGQSAWYFQNSGTTQDLYEVDFINAYTGLIVGANGTILRTTNRGDNWIQIPPPTASHIYRVTYSAVNAVYALFGTQLMKSTNGGFNWLPILSNTSSRNKLCFVSPDTGFVMAGGLKKTTDGGNTWSIISHPSTNGAYMSFFDSHTGFVSGGTLSDPGYYQTTNGGISWAFYTSNSDVSKIEAFLDSCVLICFGGTAPQYYSPNRWGNIVNLNIVNVETASFCKPQLGLLYSFMGGPNYIARYSSSTSGLQPVYWTNYSEGYYISLSFPDSNHAYCIGDNGKILATRTGGLTPIEPIANVIPEKYLLSQNYPNPFNPFTTIKFEIPKEDYVRINIYNMAGMEVKSIINGAVRSGSYEIKWDGSGYSSGVYYVRMQAGDFVQTRKMVLMK